MLNHEDAKQLLLHNKFSRMYLNLVNFLKFENMRGRREEGVHVAFTIFLNTKMTKTGLKSG